MWVITRLLRLFVFFAGLRAVLGSTDPQDAAALRSLMDEWQNLPPSWGQSDDPCGTPWDGVVCANTRVIELKLPTMGIKGTLSGDIGHLTQLQILDLSYNGDLGGLLTPSIGNLEHLKNLILSGCSFTGNIPQELGKLAELSFLDLGSNSFTGPIPPSIGNLSNLYWLGLAGNQLSGPLPISTNKSPGLDSLLNAKHFHLNKNRLSGNIPAKLFNSQMQLIHVLLDANNLAGPIPDSIGLLPFLEVLRLDMNSLSGPVPSNINNLTSINELNLANNHLSGPMPDLTGMNNLAYVDLSNNTFDTANAPTWFLTLQSLAFLVIESGGLQGEIPQQMFSLPLQQVILNKNAFNGTLNMGTRVSSQLQTVSFENNSISSVILSNYNETLILIGNPVCNGELGSSRFCKK